MLALKLELPQTMTPINDRKFHDLCKKNPESRIERTGEGDIVIMAPTGGETGKRNFLLAVKIGKWNEEMKLGVLFDSSTAFKLPSSAIRSPDIAFVRTKKWKSLSKEEKKKFPPLCPDFVIELLSDSDSILLAKEKMDEWMKNGCELAWLINLDSQKIHIYRKDKPIQECKGLKHTLSGESTLPGFELNLKEIL
jgi:Uma2 family endonuclease